MTLKQVVENLLKKVNSSKEHPKVRERAAIAVGYLCVGDTTGFPLRQKVIEGLLSCAENRQYELKIKKDTDSKDKNPMENFEFYFTVGESLVCAALGIKSSANKDIWIEEGVDRLHLKEEDDVSTLLSLLLEKYLTNLNPHIRQVKS